jgi:hypothetical protein
VWVDPKRTGLGGCLWRLVASKRVGNAAENKRVLLVICCLIETLTDAIARLEDMIGDDVFELYVVLLAS